MQISLVGIYVNSQLKTMLKLVFLETLILNKKQYLYYDYENQRDFYLLLHRDKMAGNIFLNFVMVIADNLCQHKQTLSKSNRILKVSKAHTYSLQKHSDTFKYINILLHRYITQQRYLHCIAFFLKSVITLLHFFKNCLR